MAILGIDIGGSGIKGALVDTSLGKLVSDRVRIPTPETPKPKAVAGVILKIVEKLHYAGPIGCGFPGVVKHGKTYSAANIHKDWIGYDAEAMIRKTTGCDTFFLNDADAAGIAEMQFGIGKKNSKGAVLFLTVGTGIGSAFFYDGILIPNFELGHLDVKGKEAEHRASDAARQDHKLSWKEWGKQFSLVLRTYDKLFSPDLFILGGGVSSRYEKFKEYINCDVKVVPAELENLAGIVGAAMAAEAHFKKS